MFATRCIILDLVDDRDYDCHRVVDIKVFLHYFRLIVAYSIPEIHHQLLRRVPCTV